MIVIVYKRSLIYLLTSSKNWPVLMLICTCVLRSVWSPLLQSSPTCSRFSLWGALLLLAAVTLRGGTYHSGNIWSLDSVCSMLLPMPGEALAVKAGEYLMYLELMIFRFDHYLYI